ncbi:MAG: DUF1080 domain-containing protein [Planctomycetes bacterium]|nr:DUF1080 domain-containing protein [Planctomycetota bacterium]
MKRAFLALVLGYAAAGICAAGDNGFVAMFNGKDLSGWEGLPGAWRVENGAIVGESTPERPCKRTHYLYWKGGEPADFILKAKIKLIGGNSGIQFRSAKRPHFDTFGYQADFDAANQYTGCLYQHKRGLVARRGERVIFTETGERKVEKFANFDELLKHVRQNDWNDYEIIARGSHITLRLNGQLMCEVEDHDPQLAREKGIIALQMHQGPPMRVEFKELRIKILK